MTVTIMLFVVPPAGIFLVLMFYVLSIGLQTRRVDLRSEPPAPVDAGPWRLRPMLLTHRGLNGPRT